MDEEKYNYLLSLGFSPLDIDDIEIYNKDIYTIELDKLKETMDFLLSFKLSKKELVKVITNNYDLITENVRRLKMIEVIYSEKIGLSNEEIKNLLLKNNNAFSLTITEFNNVVDYIISKGIHKEKLKGVILNHSDFVNLSLSDIKKVVY